MNAIYVTLTFLILVNVVLATLHLHVTENKVFAWSHLILAVISVVVLALGVSGWLN